MPFVPFGLYHDHYGQARAAPASSAVDYHHSRSFHATVDAPVPAAAADTVDAAAADTTTDKAAAGTAAVGTAAAAAVPPGQILGPPIHSFGTVPRPYSHRHRPSFHVRHWRSGFYTLASTSTVVGATSSSTIVSPSEPQARPFSIAFQPI